MPAGPGRQVTNVAAAGQRAQGGVIFPSIREDDFIEQGEMDDTGREGRAA